MKRKQVRSRRVAARNALRSRRRLGKRGDGAVAGWSRRQVAAGGMLDVYFATRYFSCAMMFRMEGDDRSTTTTLERLRATGSLDGADFTH